MLVIYPYVGKFRLTQRFHINMSLITYLFRLQLFLDLKLLHDGPCKMSEIPQDIPPEEACDIEARFPVIAPVCGSDNVTYMSIFSLWCTSINETGKHDYK